MEGHESIQSDFVQSAELCGSCHDVFNYPGLRIEEAYTEYSSSPAKDMGLTCQDCHMGSVPAAVSSRPVEPIAVVEGKTYPDENGLPIVLLVPIILFSTSFPIQMI